MSKLPITLLVATLGAAWLTGCGSSKLTVEVAVLNKEYLEKFRALPLPEDRKRQASLAQALIRDGGVLSEDDTRSLAKKFDALGSDVATSTLIAARDDVASSIDMINASRDVDASEAVVMYTEGLMSLQNAERRLGDLREDLPEGASKDLREELDKQIQAVQRVTAIADRRSDPLLSVALNADEEHWQGVFNFAKAYATGTNSDIAIVMDDVDKFSVKGIRADSTTGTKATFIALGRVMDIAAAVSGVPIGGLLPDPEPMTDDQNQNGTEDARRAAAETRASLKARSQIARLEMIRLAEAALRPGSATLDDLKANEESTFDADAFAGIVEGLKSLTDDAGN